MTESIELLLFNVNTTKHKEKKILAIFDRKNNTAALIGINLYSVLFVYLFFQFLECSAKYAYCT